MADQPLSMDELLQESRKKRRAEELAQQIFGKNRRPRTPVGQRPDPGASLASRVGVAKRPSSLSRSNTAPPRTSRPLPAQANRGRPTRSRPSDVPLDLNGGGDGGQMRTTANNNGGLSIRGAATVGPFVVVAQNFAPGTTAADIESVMADVGGQITECRLVSSNPTVIAEMTFVEKSGADAVIRTFNNKKADGRILYVWMKTIEGGSRGRASQGRLAAEYYESEDPGDDVMELDPNAEAREMENRLREERRSRMERGTKEGPVQAPRQGGGYKDDLYPGSRRPEPKYQDGRYGFGRDEERREQDYGRDDQRRDDGNGRRGRYGGGGRVYSDNMRRGGRWNT